MVSLDLNVKPSTCAPRLNHQQMNRKIMGSDDAAVAEDKNAYVVRAHTWKNFQVDKKQFVLLKLSCQDSLRRERLTYCGIIC